MIMKKETVEEFLARGGRIERSEKVFGENALRKRFGSNLSAKIGKIIDSNGRKRAGSIGNCNEALSVSNMNSVGFQNCNSTWLNVK
jgi:hypothetical protein